MQNYDNLRITKQSTSTLRKLQIGITAQKYWFIYKVVYIQDGKFKSDANHKIAISVTEHGERMRL